MTRLLHLDEPPTAVFAYNDVNAIGPLRAIANAGLRVPQDISIVGFDDIPLASAVVPSLTTIAQPIAELGTLATELLISRIRGSNTSPGQRIMLETRLVVRESCAPYCN